MAMIDISVDEILHALSSFEKRELFDELSDAFEKEDGPRLGGHKKSLTQTESDFQQALLELWEMRSILTPEQIGRITGIISEPKI